MYFSTCSTSSIEIIVLYNHVSNLRDLNSIILVNCVSSSTSVVSSVNHN